MKKIALLTASVVSVVMFTGCAHKVIGTPAVMTYDGSSVNYSTVESMKHAKICKDMASPDGDTSIITAAKTAGVSKVIHVDVSNEHKSFLIWDFGFQQCITVYGE